MIIEIDNENINISAQNTVENINIAYVNSKTPLRNDLAYFKILRVQCNVKLSTNLFLTTPNIG